MYVLVDMIQERILLSDAEKSNIMALSQPGWHSGQVRGIAHSTAGTALKSQGSTNWSASSRYQDAVHAVVLPAGKL